MSIQTKRILLKFGTGILTRAETGSIDREQIRSLSRQVAALVEAGHECIIVSSGAVGAGLMMLGLSERPGELAGMQACAAVGQSKLMELYETAFAAHDIHVAQLLLTHSDLDSRTRYSNASNTLRWLLARGNVVPIINENDSVAVEELRVGDNDLLSAQVAILAGADLLVLLTSADGLMKGEELVQEVRDIRSVLAYVKPTKGKLSVGGMATKLQAVKTAVDAGITTVIANGRTPGVVQAVLAGTPGAGTRFYPPSPACPPVSTTAHGS